MKKQTSIQRSSSLFGIKAISVTTLIMLLSVMIPIVLAQSASSFLSDDNLKSFNEFKYKYFIDKSIEERTTRVELDWSSFSALWTSAHLRWQPFHIFMVFYASVVLAYFFSGVLFMGVEYFGIWQQHKIQPKLHTTKKQYIEAANNFLLNYIFIILPLAFISFPLFEYMGIKHNSEMPSLMQLFGYMVVFLLIEDFFEYWGHRFLHIGPFYTYIHKVHHHFQAPFGFTAAYAHPIETLWLGLATFIPLFIFRPHLIVFYIWVHVRQFDSVITHCGYDLPINPLDILRPFYGGTKFHDYHHTTFYYNYASRFTWLDKLFNTYKDPDEKKKRN